MDGSLYEVANMIKAVAVFLGGPFIGLLVKVIIDFVDKQKERQFQLEKIFYEKRLSAAEEVIKSLFKSYQATITLVNTIDVLLKSDADELDSSVFEAVFQNYSDLIDKSEKEILSSFAPLYFQLENEQFWSNDDQKNLIGIYSRMKVLNGFIIACNETEDETKQKKMDSYYEELRCEFYLLQEAMKKSSQAIFKTIELVKEEVQKERKVYEK